MRQEILEKITENKSMMQINLANLQIKDDEVLDILEAIKTHKPTVSIIDFDNNEIGDKGAQILSTQLSHFNNITELSLQFNKVGREGAVELFGLKKTFPDLDILFHGNQIVDVREMDEIEQLARAESPKP